MAKLVLSKFLKEELQKIESITSNAVPLDVAEHMILGTDHAEIGALISAKWFFPIDIVNAVYWHHNPERIKNSDMQSDIVCLSNQRCQSNADRDSVSGQFAKPSSAVLKRLGMKLDQHKEMALKAHNWMEKLSDTLTFD